MFGQRPNDILALGIRPRYLRWQQFCHWPTANFTLFSACATHVNLAFGQQIFVAIIIPGALPLAKVGIGRWPILCGALVGCGWGGAG